MWASRTADAHVTTPRARLPPRPRGPEGVAKDDALDDRDAICPWYADGDGYLGCEDADADGWRPVEGDRDDSGMPLVTPYDPEDRALVNAWIRQGARPQGQIVSARSRRTRSSAAASAGLGPELIEGHVPLAEQLTEEPLGVDRRGQRAQRGGGAGQPAAGGSGLSISRARSARAG